MAGYGTILVICVGLYIHTPPATYWQSVITWFGGLSSGSILGFVVHLRAEVMDYLWEGKPRIQEQLKRLADKQKSAVQEPGK